MSPILSPRLGITVLLAIAVAFAANHVAARFAIDHGASVAFAVTMRSVCTALFLVALLRLQRVPMALERPALWRSLLVGLLVALQSFFLYSAVARIPVALALLVFQTFPMLFVLLSWAAAREAPPRRALLVMPLALIGLALALDVGTAAGGERWGEMGSGVAFAFGAALVFTLVLFLNAHWLKAVDGRLRTFLMMAVTGVVVFAAGGAANALHAPVEAIGWVGIALLTLFYGGAITSLFVVLPRLGGGAASTIALNFEPIAALLLAWTFLDQAVRPLQVVGAFLVVGTIAWMSAAKR
jgi:drug/metabolite transporter (DMT)-like permease